MTSARMRRASDPDPKARRAPQGGRLLSRRSLGGDVASGTHAPGSARRHAARVLEVDSLAEVARELERTESEPEGVALMAPKGRVYAVRLDDVPLKAAPLLKQELLAVGGDSAHARGIADHSAPTTSAVLLATWGQYRRMLPKLARQPFRLAAIGEEVERALRAYLRHGPREVRGAHRSLTVGDRPRVMGVVNVTPDSFSDGGRFLDPKAAVAHAEQLVGEGADLVDVGGESTRPGATPVSAEAEWRRIEPVLRGLAGRISVPISVDTRHAEVALQAVDAGADLVNDVEGLRDEGMRRAVARSGAAAVVMHMRGSPTTMQEDLAYADVRDEVFRWLAARTEEAVADGVAPDRLLVDPGIGFGKSPEQSFELLAHAGEFRSLGYPVVLGASRKSFLGAALGSKDPGERLEAGLAAAVLAAEHGVEVIRTHDVGPTVRALAVVAAARRSVAPGPVPLSEE
jgi:dihydropteroate synthase